MNQLFFQNGYLYVPNFITTTEAEILAKQFREYTDSQSIQGDPQVPISKADYNFMPFVLLLVNKVADVNKLYGHYVLPTYTYARIYQKGAELKEHTDRPACEVSLSVNLSKTHEWPIFFKTPDNKTVSLELDPGDAVMYYGCARPHWRNVYEGDEHVQVFLHYVAAYGENNWAFFDKRTTKPSAPSYFNKYAVGKIPLIIYE